MRSFELMPLVAMLDLAGVARHVWLPATGTQDAAPRTFLLRGEELQAIRSALARPAPDETLANGYRRLLELADEALSAGPFSVIDKQEAPSGGTVNDYYSIAKYWWPNPKTISRLPYVMLDGKINPEVYSDRYDAERLDQLADTVHILALAFYLSEDERYGQRAALLLRTWFVDERTRQTPHFTHAQAVLGRSDVRGIGIVEARSYLYLVDAEALLAGCASWTPADRSAFRDWFRRFLHWMRTSEQGRHAAGLSNNIALWYDLQCAVYALLVNERELAQLILRDGVLARLAAQVEPDGSQPEELQRVRPYDYVAFSLLAMMGLARAGEALGFDAWWRETEDGRSFQRAADWLLRLSRGQTRAAAGRAEGQSSSALATASGGTSETDYGAAGWEAAAVAATLRAEHLESALRWATQRADALEKMLKRSEASGSNLSRQLQQANERRRAGQMHGGAGGRAAVAISRIATPAAPGAEPEMAVSATAAVHVPRLIPNAPVEQETDTFVLYRIIGNDLVPRHAKGQSRENVRFLLEHEPALEQCEKHWVLNRIFDAAEETAIIELLERHGQPYLRIPFDWDEYARIPWDLERFPEPAFFLSDAYRRLGPEQKARAEAQVRRLKNLYVMNNNGARNAALRDGRARAKWILPWDGNCFVTGSAWSALLKRIRAERQIRYFIVPMARISNRMDLLKPDFAPAAAEEPQVMFRRDAGESFNEAHPYGRRPKVELLWRLGVPGPWDRWHDDAWELPREPLSGEARNFGYAGWVARLPSGQDHLERADIQSFKNRGLARVEAICATLDHLDEQCLRRRFDPDRLTAYREERLDALQRSDSPLFGRLIEEAEAALQRGPYSVTHKTSLPPSGDRHDYWHVAPYWWPNPNTPDGLPYVVRDGERAPGTQMYEPDSDRYDRTRLQRFLDDTTLLALAWRATGEPRYAEHAACLVRTWFLDRETRMNPHLRYAQVRPGHNRNEGLSSGIIEMKDLYYFLDAARLLERARVLTPDDLTALRDWLRQYLEWLLTSPQGQKEGVAPNNHGPYYDLQVAAVAAYLGDLRAVGAAFRRCRDRVHQHFETDGRQPHEMGRTITAHYCCFNLQGWISLATLASTFGDDLWNYASADERSIKRALEWLLRHLPQDPWPYRQIEPFDRERFLPLYHAYRDRYAQAPPRLEGTPVPPLDAIKPLFFPHDGVKPFWQLGFSGGGK